MQNPRLCREHRPCDLGSGNAIVWALNRIGPGPGTIPIKLRAYEATDLTRAFHPGAGWDIGIWGESGRAFVSPTVIIGKVYVPCGDHVGVFYYA